MDLDGAGRRFDKARHQVDERALAGAARAANDNHFTGVNLKVDIFKDMVFAKPFINVYKLYQLKTPYQASWSCKTKLLPG